ncbi:MAG TPA: cyclase family protein [Dehalococcoidia bacterium]|nr:cyclase family protein [Dehalococcoidia bacterium]
MTIPRYQDLPVFEKTGERHAWGIWGEGDQVGTLNFITAEKVAAASQSVRSGKVINLSLPLNYPLDLFSGRRAGYEHHMTVNRGGRDDHLDNFAMQGSSQWDGLRHVRYREFGYYGGHQDEDVDSRGLLGIEHWARRGILGRGVLIDIERFLKVTGEPVDPEVKRSFSPEQIEACAADQGIQLQSGDIVLLRTGWLTWHRNLPVEKREALRGRMFGENAIGIPGLDAGQSTAAWLWDRQIAAMAADNPGLEAMPVDAAVGFQHRRIIALLGMPIGELWDLDDLAADCTADGRYHFLLVSAPLYVPGGVGSPINAYAVK